MVFGNDQENYQYNGTFTDNTLVVRQKGCGKTFVQNLGKNKTFLELKSVTGYRK